MSLVLITYKTFLNSSYQIDLGSLSYWVGFVQKTLEKQSIFGSSDIVMLIRTVERESFRHLVHKLVTKNP